MDSKMNDLFRRWEKQLSTKADIIFPDDGKAYPTTSRDGKEGYFTKDGAFPGYYQNLHKRVCFIGREARYHSGDPDVTIPTLREGKSKLLQVYRIIFYLMYGIKQNGEKSYSDLPDAYDIFKQFDQSHNFGFAFVNLSKYSNDSDSGANRDIELMKRSFEDSELEKHNFFEEELSILNPDIFITMNIFNTGLPKKYIDLCFNPNNLKKNTELSIPNKADVYDFTLNGKRTLLIDLYHFSDRKSTEEFFYTPVMDILFPKKSSGKYIVKFNTKGGSPVESLIVEKGERIDTPEDPSKNHSKFIGWFLDSSCSDEFDFKKPINDNITLFAKWKKDDTGGNKNESNKQPVNNLKKDDTGGNKNKSNKQPVINWKVLGLIVLISVGILLLVLLFRNCTFTKTNKHKESNVSEIQKDNEVKSDSVEIETPITETAPKDIEIKETVSEYYSKTVESGDTYFSIAATEYSNRHFWPVLYDLNKNLNKDPDILEVNEILQLPITNMNNSSYMNYVELNKENLMRAYYSTYLAYEAVDKHYFAVRVLSSGEMVIEGFLDYYKAKIPDVDFLEATNSVKFTKEYDENN